MKFSETSGVGQVRIARLGSPDDMAGYWSYVGTEILEIPEDQPTMNLEGFTMRTSKAEFKRVVRHEAGHNLGFDHEHTRSDIVKLIDRDKAISFPTRLPEEVEAQVLTPLANKSIMGTKESDPLSIMCHQLSAAIMKNSKPIKGGKDINLTDHAFAASLYPKRSRTATPPPLDIEDISQPPRGSARPGAREQPETPRHRQARDRSPAPHTAQRSGKRIRTGDYGRVSAEPSCAAQR